MKADTLAARGGGFLYLAARGCPTQRIPTQTSEHAVMMWEKYRDGFGLGASDLKPNCGNVYANSGELVARVSYNGRVWSPDGALLSD